MYVRAWRFSDESDVPPVSQCVDAPCNHAIMQSLSFLGFNRIQSPTVLQLDALL